MSARPLLLSPRVVVHEVILSVLPSLTPEDIDESVHLKDLGADSVDRVEIITAVLDRLAPQETLSTFSDVPNIGALIQLLVELQGRRT